MDNEISICGWHESESGVDFWNCEGSTIKACMEVLYNDFGEDCVGVDLEATDEDGEDVSLKCANLLNQIYETRKD